MKVVDAQAETLLGTILRSRKHIVTPAAGIDVLEVLFGLARTWPEPLAGDRRRDLEQLCRKLHVARDVRAVYRPGWKRSRGAERLSGASWPLLIAVLLAYASLAGGGETERGLALKSLNAALSALDLAKSAGLTEHLDELDAWSERILATLVGMTDG